jgi:hypothetical protein
MAHPPRTIKADESKRVKHKKKKPLLVYVQGDEPNVWHLATPEQRATILGLKKGSKNQCCYEPGVGECRSATHYADTRHITANHEGAIPRLWFVGRRPPTHIGHSGAIRCAEGAKHYEERVAAVLAEREAAAAAEADAVAKSVAIYQEKMAKHYADREAEAEAAFAASGVLFFKSQSPYV